MDSVTPLCCDQSTTVQAQFKVLVKGERDWGGRLQQEQDPVLNCQSHGFSRDVSATPVEEKR